MLGALLTTQACAEVTDPAYDDVATDVTASALANAPLQNGGLGPAINLPPLQPKPTFWTCAASAEGIFAAEATQILILEIRALTEPDPFRQSVMLAEVARRKHEAKKALYFALQQCVATYGAPRWFAVEDENGNLVLVPFTVGAYHAYLVEKYLESPE
jgi:hypothetical protein